MVDNNVKIQYQWVGHSFIVNIQYWRLLDFNYGRTSPVPGMRVYLQSSFKLYWHQCHIDPQVDL